MTIKKLFEQLISQIDPDNTLINEEKRAELTQLFEEKISEVKTKAFEDGVDSITEEHTEKLKNVMKIMEDMDEDHAEKLKEITESIDDDHTDMLKEVVEYMDEDHAELLEKVLNKYDNEHTEKLQEVVDLYESKENVDITENVSNYLDTYLETVKPESTMVNEERLNKLEQTFSQMKELLMVNEDYVQTEIKEAIIEAHEIIEEKEKEINKLMFEKIEANKKIKLTEATINEKVEKLESEILLENKIKGCSPKLQAYLELCFNDASKNEIEGKFDEAVEAFKETERTKREVIIENQKELGDNHINPEEVKTEGIFENKIEKSMEERTIDNYASIIKKTSKRT